MSRDIDVVTITGTEYDDLMVDAERYRCLEEALQHIAEHGVAFKDWKLAQLVLGGTSFEEALQTVREKSE